MRTRKTRRARTRFDIVSLSSRMLGGFILIQGSTEQIKLLAVRQDLLSVKVIE